MTHTIVYPWATLARVYQRMVERLRRRYRKSALDTANYRRTRAEPMHLTDSLPTIGPGRSVSAHTAATERNPMKPTDGHRPNPEVDRGLAAHLEALVGPTRTPNCPEPTDLFDTKLGVAPLEVREAVEKHLHTGCAFCAAKMTAYAYWLGERTELPEPTVTIPATPAPKPARRVPDVPKVIALSAPAAPVARAGRLSLTILAAAGDLPRLRPLLRPRTAGLLERAGLLTASDGPDVRAPLVAALIDFICEQIAGWTGGERFATSIPMWVEEFAKQQQLTDRLIPLPESTPLVLEEYAVTHVLRSRPGAPETAEALVRATALATNVSTIDAILHLPRPSSSSFTEPSWSEAVTALAIQAREELKLWTET